MTDQNEKPKSKRNPFPDEPFYVVPIKLLDCGLARDLTSGDFKRYSTFLRLANYYQKTEFQATLRGLERLDGISARAAFDTHARLQEHKMIIVERYTNPYTYALLLPSEWQSRNGVPYPASKIPRSYVWRL